MFDPGWFNEERTGKGAPLLEPFGFAENDHMMVDTFPIYAQAKAGRIFHHPLQPHPVTAVRRLEMRGRGSNGCNEFLRLSRVDRNVGDFCNHGPRMALHEGCGKP